MTTWIDELKKLQACDDAIAWCRSYPDLETAWAVCERGDWMLWLAAKTLDRKLVVAAACAWAACAAYASDAARSESLKESADICRRMLPCPTLKASV